MRAHIMIKNRTIVALAVISSPLVYSIARGQTITNPKPLETFTGED
jgi:hypothetical protein